MATIKIKQIKSRIGSTKEQRGTLDSLGLTKINKVVEHKDTPSLRGAMKKVHHLVTIIE